MATNSFSKADVFYRRIIRNKFFRQGWGTIDMFRNLQRLKRNLFDAEMFKEMVSIDGLNFKITKNTKVGESYSVIDGHFLSPLAKFYPGVLPRESEKAIFQAIVPNTSKEKTPMCVMLAGTGDHYFWRRRNLIAKPLAKQNTVGSVMLVNPYYGWRKPKGQKGSSLNHVVDLLIMGCALIVETSVLLNWCERQGFGPLALTGVSLGGHMASIAGTFVQKPLPIIPCLSWTTASLAFTEGVLSKAVAWSVLENQLEDLNFLEQLCHICQEVEIDGLNARSCRIATSRKDYSPDFLYEFLNVSLSSASIKPSFDHQANFANQNQYSVSLDMSAKYLEWLLKDKLLSYLPVFRSRPTKEASYEKARSFMKYILNITTHLGYYRVPYDPNLAVFVEAELDGYVPREDCLSPIDIWPGCQIEYTKCGHVAAALYKQDFFREIIAETLKKMP